MNPRISTRRKTAPTTSAAVRSGLRRTVDAAELTIVISSLDHVKHFQRRAAYDVENDDAGFRGPPTFSGCRSAGTGPFDSPTTGNTHTAPTDLGPHVSRLRR